MRGAGYGLAVVGVILVLGAVLNHWVIKTNPIAHTSTILAGVGAVVAVIGIILTFVGGRSSGANA